MKGTVYIDNYEIGWADFKVCDEGMGGISGQLMPTELYSKYVKQIQALYDKRGIAGMGDFNFQIILENNTLLKPDGGIGITHSVEFEDEIIVESAGIAWDIIEKIKESNEK
ncbi:MAG TPA: hypothetical protein VIM75_22255 [Ohtaekwangia sp.]|uniref:hypothetical protein n=1 Tax=Ohtaekwangia sp. TaxID=2066019 RepID=UPI002F91D83F